MKYKGLNDNKITVEAGIANGIIGKARKRGSLSLENISKLLLTYPELDADWLIIGKGEMLKDHSDKLEVHKVENCLLCAEKDRTISVLKASNDYMKEATEDLKDRIKDLEKKFSKIA